VHARHPRRRRSTRAAERRLGAARLAPRKFLGRSRRHSGARREGGFTAIKLEVGGGNLEMYNIKITFGNGETWSPNTRVQFREGSWSRRSICPAPFA